MGASAIQYWRYVALPILTPPCSAAMILLFGNAFGAQATAYQLTGGQVNLVPLLIGNQISGDVLHNVGSRVTPWRWAWSSIMGDHDRSLPLLQRRAERWLR